MPIKSRHSSNSTNLCIFLVKPWFFLVLTTGGINFQIMSTNVLIRSTSHSVIKTIFGLCLISANTYWRFLSVTWYCFVLFIEKFDLPILIEIIKEPLQIFVCTIFVVAVTLKNLVSPAVLYFFKFLSRLYVRW